MSFDWGKLVEYGFRIAFFAMLTWFYYRTVRGRRLWLSEHALQSTIDYVRALPWITGLFVATVVWEIFVPPAPQWLPTFAWYLFVVLILRNIAHSLIERRRERRSNR